MTSAPFIDTKYLDAIDAGLAHMYAAACMHKWDWLPAYAEKVQEAGGTCQQIQASVRHLIVFAGYGPCLAAAISLKKAKMIPEDFPGKVGGPPGNAFELVYGTVSDQVRKKVEDADPVLSEWIQRHLYGDVYSSPGISLRQKQLLTMVGLIHAGMMEQLFGHALAGLRFGCTLDQMEELIDIVSCVAKSVSLTDPSTQYSKANKMLYLAQSKFSRDAKSGDSSIVNQEPELVTLQDST
eukprot:jgi/Picsp_1/1027/NSC_04511-R1_carboxymuconolactone decarboxylase